MAASPQKIISPVVDDNRINLKHVESAHATIGSPAPPGRGQNRMATRAANATKHPGLLALDDEDLKAIKKKDDAALRRQAKADEKKANQARLHANTDRIATFEDALSQQHANSLANAARPPTRAAATKAVRPTQLNPSDQPQGDLGSGHLVESDASGVDDYLPSGDSELELDRKSVV